MMVPRPDGPSLQLPTRGSIGHIMIVSPPLKVPTGGNMPTGKQGIIFFVHTNQRDSTPLKDPTGSD